MILVAGHTGGEIVLLDREVRGLYAGDACNSNTLLHFSNYSVEEYRDYLINLKRYTPDFDVLWCGHEEFGTWVIDEGIALCEKTMAGQAAAEKGAFHGGNVTYAAPREATRGHFNIPINPQKIHKAPKAPRVL